MVEGLPLPQPFRDWPVAPIGPEDAMSFRPFVSQDVNIGTLAVGDVGELHDLVALNLLPVDWPGRIGPAGRDYLLLEADLGAPERQVGQLAGDRRLLLPNL